MKILKQMSYMMSNVLLVLWKYTKCSVNGQIVNNIIFIIMLTLSQITMSYQFFFKHICLHLLGHLQHALRIGHVQTIDVKFGRWSHCSGSPSGFKSSSSSSHEEEIDIQRLMDPRVCVYKTNLFIQPFKIGIGIIADIFFRPFWFLF